MSGSIYLVRGEELVEMTEQPYKLEDHLQQWIAQHPALLAGDQINNDSPRRWLLVSREFAVASEAGGAGRWSLDHLFFDQDAVPTLIEVKRSSDTRIRREVVGQMLDYAANGPKYWPIEAIRAEFIANCQKRGEDADARLADFLGPDADTELFWQTAKTNLETGRLRLVFVADVIPPEIRRVIEFLNAQMDRTEVLAVEVKQFVGQGLTTLVPRVVGQTERAQQKKVNGIASERRQQNEQTFFAEFAAARPQDERDAVEAIYAWMSNHDIPATWGTGRMGSMIPAFVHAGTKHYFCIIWTNGTIYLNFREMRSRAPFSDPALREALRARFNAINGVDIVKGAIDGQPPIRIATVATPNGLRQFIDTFAWYVETVRAS